MVQGLVNQMKSAKQERGSAVSSKAAREQDKAAAEGELADTTNGLTEDEKFLAELSAECEQKTADYQKRQEVRQEELDAIQKAIEIMSGDAVQGGSEHLPSMVQHRHWSSFGAP